YVSETLEALRPIRSLVRGEGPVVPPCEGSRRIGGWVDEGGTPESGGAATPRTTRRSIRVRRCIRPASQHASPLSNAPHSSSACRSACLDCAKGGEPVAEA